MFGLMAVAFPGHMWRPLLQRAISRELWKLASADGKLPLHFFARSSKLGASLSEFFFFFAKLIILFAYIFIETTQRRTSHGTHMWFACAVRHRLHGDHHYDHSPSPDSHIHMYVWMNAMMTIAIMTIVVGFHNVWLQFTIYTSFSGDNFKWNVSTSTECFARFPVSVRYSPRRFSCVKQ